MRNFLRYQSKTARLKPRKALPRSCSLVTSVRKTRESSASMFQEVLWKK